MPNWESLKRQKAHLLFSLEKMTHIRILIFALGLSDIIVIVSRRLVGALVFHTIIAAHFDPFLGVKLTFSSTHRFVDRLQTILQLPQNRSKLTLHHFGTQLLQLRLQTQCSVRFGADIGCMFDQIIFEKSIEFCFWDNRRGVVEKTSDWCGLSSFWKM